MMKLIRALRRNPDAIAVAALCVVLGIGRQAVVAQPMSAFSSKTLGIHWICVKPAAEALDDLRTRLRHLACSAPEALHLPDFRR
jgi:hypothetical protein